MNSRKLYNEYYIEGSDEVRQEECANHLINNSCKIYLILKWCGNLFVEIQESLKGNKDFQEQYYFAPKFGCLYYANGEKLEQLDIVEMIKFRLDWEAIMEVDGKYYHEKHLSYAEINQLVTSHTGHIPYSKIALDKQALANSPTGSRKKLLDDLFPDATKVKATNQNCLPMVHPQLKR